MKNKWLTPQDVAEELQFTAEYVEDLVSQKKVAAVSFDGQIRISRGELNRHLKRASTTRRHWPKPALWAASVVLAAMVGVSVTSYIYAQTTEPPLSQTIPYQGYLELAGQPVDGDKELTFCLSQSSDPAAECVWSETQIAQVVAGRFAVSLGSEAGLGSALDGAQNLWLGISIRDVDPGTGLGTGDAVALEGKQSLGAVPFAFRGAPGAGFIVDGNLGVGTSTPETKLDVNGTASLGYTHIRPQNDVNEGGEILLEGAGAYNDWAVDTITGSFRLHHDGQVYLELASDGMLYVRGTIEASSFLPQYTSPWTLVQGSAEHVFTHGFGTIPSQVMLLQCGALSGDTCTTRVVMSGTQGHQDPGAQLNPLSVTADTNSVYVSTTSSWWMWGYWVGSSLTTAGDGDGNPFTAYYRVIAWL